MNLSPHENLGFFQFLSLYAASFILGIYLGIVVTFVTLTLFGAMPKIDYSEEDVWTIIIKFWNMLFIFFFIIGPTTSFVFGLYMLPTATLGIIISIIFIKKKIRHIFVWITTYSSLFILSSLFLQTINVDILPIQFHVLPSALMGCFIWIFLEKAVYIDTQNPEHKNQDPVSGFTTLTTKED